MSSDESDFMESQSGESDSDNDFSSESDELPVTAPTKKTAAPKSATTKAAASMSGAKATTPKNAPKAAKSSEPVETKKKVLIKGGGKRAIDSVSDSDLDLDDEGDRSKKIKLSTKNDVQISVSSPVVPPAQKKASDTPQFVSHSKATAQPIKKSSNSIITQSVKVAGVTASTTSRLGPTSSSTSSSSLPSSSSTTLASMASMASEDITRGPDVVTESSAKKLILQYMKQQNRPYSAMQVFDNLHKRVAKSLTERALESLAKTPNSGILVKEYGKAKIYFPDQSKLGGATSVQLDTMDRDISSLHEHLEVMQAKERRQHAALDQLRSEPADDELDGVLAAMEKTVAEKRSRVQSISSAPQDPQALAGAIKAHNFYRTQWAERRAATMEAVSHIADGLEKKEKVVLAELGLETDEDCGVQLRDFVSIPEIKQSS